MKTSLLHKILNNLTFGIYGFIINIINSRKYNRLAILNHEYEMVLISNINLMPIAYQAKYFSMAAIFEIDYKLTQMWDIKNIKILEERIEYIETEFLEIEYFRQLSILKNREQNLKELEEDV